MLNIMRRVDVTFTVTHTPKFFSFEVQRRVDPDRPAMEMPSQEKKQDEDIDHHRSRTKDSDFATGPIVKEAISYWESVQTSPDPSRLTSGGQESHSLDIVSRRNNFGLDSNKCSRKPGSFLQHRRTTSEGGTRPIRKKDLEEVEVNREEKEERKSLAVNNETANLKERRLFYESAADNHDQTDEKKKGSEERDQEDEKRNKAGGGSPNCISQEALMNVVVNEEVKSVSSSSDENESEIGSKEELCFDYCQCCDCTCITCVSSAASSSEDVASERMRRQAHCGYGRRWIFCIGFLVVIAFSLKSFYEDQDYEMFLVPT